MHAYIKYSNTCFEFIIIIDDRVKSNFRIGTISLKKKVKLVYSSSWQDEITPLGGRFCPKINKPYQPLQSHKIILLETIPLPIWWTPECTCLIKERKKALRKWRSSLAPGDFLSYNRSDATVKRELTSLKKESFRNFNSSFSRETDLSTIWRCSRAFRTSRKKRAASLLSFICRL